MTVVATPAPAELAPVKRRRFLPPMPALARVFAAVWLATFVVLLINDPGQMTFDTKLSVDVNPGGYFGSLWHLWDPQDTFGTLNNQAIGYAMPMAPVYLAGHLVHAPVWLTERFWLSLIIAVGATGLIKLAAALRIGSPASRLAAGLMFALWPTFTIVIGSTSAAALPGMLAPWAVLPLVTSGGARWRDVAWPAARSGAAVLCMGGVNATSTLDVLILPGLFILCAFRGWHLVRMGLAWLAALAAATAWWLLPLLLQNKYAFNFLPYVEQSSTTTHTTSATAVLRGAGNWTAYLNFGTPWLSAGWTMVTSPFAVLAASAVTAVGLYGLARRGMPGAVWLRLAVGIAALVLLIGYSGPLGGPLHVAVGHLLDGTLAPFRNVYKVEPIIAVALTLGLAYAMAEWLTWANSSIPDWRQAIGWAARIAAAAAIIGLAMPYLSDRILNPGPFGALPAYWQQTASYLAAHSPHNPALVMPADAHGDYLWGDPIDDPLVADATSPWVQRGLVPYGGAGAQALLSAAEQAIESGEQVPGLAAFLTRAGIGYVVVRNDLDPNQIGYTSAIVVHQTLRQSGFTRVASFGPQVSAQPTGAANITPQFQAALPVYPSVEVFAVPGFSDPEPATALGAARTALVDGGPDSLLQLAGQGLLRDSQAAVIAGDTVPVKPVAWYVTDGQRRQDNAFGLINENVSYTYTATETNPADDQLGASGDPPRQLLPVPAAGHQTVAVLSGAAAVSASSYGAWLSDTEQEDPASAFDGNPGTAWAEGNPVTPAGQWIQIAFSGKLALPASVRIRLLDDSPYRELASTVTVSTATGSVTDSLAATGAAQPLAIPAGPTTWLRITFTAARRVTTGGPGAGISDVLIPGVTVTRLLEPPESGTGTPDFSFSQQVPSLLSFASPGSTAPMARTFGLAAPQVYQLKATALALPGSALDAITQSLGTSPGSGELLASVASADGQLPEAFPAGVLNGTGLVPWVATTSHPVIHLRWQGKRRITSLSAIPPLSGASIPATVRISSPAGVRTATVQSGGLVRFRPLVTDQIDVSFPSVHAVTGVNATGQVVSLPVGLSRLVIPAIEFLQARWLNPASTFTLGCRSGPDLVIDGQTYQTMVTGTVGALTTFTPVTVQLCGGAQLSMSAGQHTLVAATPGTFTVTGLSLSSGPAGSPSSRAGPPRKVTVGQWQPDSRQVTVGPGDEAYLEVHENFNAGWTASLAGHTLSAVRLDGWQQGFIVPAGAGGVVTLAFRPAGTYHLGLIVSGIAILLLIAVALCPLYLPAVRRGRVLVTVEPRSAGSWRAGSAGVLVLIALSGGLAAIAVPVLAFAARWRARLLPLLAFAAMAAAGIIAAVEASAADTDGSGAFGIPAQACALIALTAALLPPSTVTRPPQAPRKEPVTSPAGLVLRGFTVVDELSCYFDSAAEPNNVHVEVWVPGHLDVSALRDAVTSTLRATPPALIRRAAVRWWRRSFTWEIPFPPVPDADPVTVVNWETAAELDTVRDEFLKAAPALEKSPPFGLLLAVGPLRDCLILNAHHAAFDGRSCLLLLRAISDSYSGREPAAVPPRPAVTVVDEDQQPLPARRFPARVERITPVLGHHKPHSPGYGLRLIEWDGIPAVPADGDVRATVNDLLIAAFIETVRAWNATNERHQIRISMPVDARAPGEEQALGNLSRLSTIVLDPGPEDLLTAVAAQTATNKLLLTPQVGGALTTVARLPVPVGVKRLLLRLAMRTVGRLVTDTALVSNLGNVPDPPEFGGMAPEHIWFSTPAHMPRGVSLGAVSVGGRLHLCIRYRRALFDEHAAERFAASYAASLRFLEQR